MVLLDLPVSFTIFDGKFRMLNSIESTTLWPSLGCCSPTSQRSTLLSIERAKETFSRRLTGWEQFFPFLESHYCKCHHNFQGFLGLHNFKPYCNSIWGVHTPLEEWLRIGDLNRGNHAHHRLRYLGVERSEVSHGSPRTIPRTKNDWCYLSALICRRNELLFSD